MRFYSHVCIADLVHVYKPPSEYGRNQISKAKAPQDAYLAFLNNGWSMIIAGISQRVSVHPTSDQRRLRFQASVTQQQEERCVVYLSEEQTDI